MSELEKLPWKWCRYLMEEFTKRPLKDWEERLLGERAEDAIKAELKIEELRR